MKKYTKNDTEKNTKKYMTWVDIFIMLGLIVCFSIAVPFLINVFYGRGCPLIDAWDKSDLMGYYGSIMTAAAAVAGVYFTLDYSKFKQTEYEKLRVKPYFSVEPKIYIHNPQAVFSFNPKQKYIFKDLGVDYCETGEDDFPLTVLDIYKRGDNIKKKDFVDRCVVTVMTLSNVGADSAIKIKLWINEGGYSRIFSMSKDKEQVLKLVIFLGNKPDIVDKSDEKARYTKKTIALKLYYENIYGNQTYMQSGDIEVKLDELSGAFHITTPGTFFINQTEINN